MWWVDVLYLLVGLVISIYVTLRLAHYISDSEVAAVDRVMLGFTFLAIIAFWPVLLLGGLAWLVGSTFFRLTDS